MNNIALENIQQAISSYLKSIGSKIDFTDSLMSVLYVLYGIHKDYTGFESENQSLIFDKEDILLNDIYSCIREKLNNNLFGLFCELSSISHDDFEECYVDILKNIANVFSLDTRVNAEFFTPTEITQLLSYFVNESDCKSIYDPFCGTSSIVHYLSSDDIHYEGQEWSRTISILSRVNVEARYGKDKSISNNDSFLVWNKMHFDALVTCPPMNMKLTLDQRMQDFIFGSMTSNLEEMLFTRAFEINNIDMAVVLLPMAFTYSRTHAKLRQYLVDNNYLDTVIQLPDKLLYQSSIPCVIVICKRNRDSEHITFINATEIVEKEGPKKGVFDYHSFIQIYEKRKYPYCSSQHIPSVKEFKYILNPLLYLEHQHYLLENQESHTLSQILTPLTYTRDDNQEFSYIIPLSKFYSDFMGVFVNKDKAKPIKTTKRPSALKHYKPEEGVSYLLCLQSPHSKPRYALYKSKREFSCSSNVTVWGINQSIVLPEYLVYVLVNNALLKAGIGSLKDYLSIPMGIYIKSKQQEVLDKEMQAYGQKMRLEQEADEKRKGVQTNISDLEHMLGTPQMKVNNILARLEKIKPDNNNYLPTLKQLQDNVDYIFRLIHFNSASISSEAFNLKEQSLTDYLNDYVLSWNNYGGNYFDLSVKLLTENTFNIIFDKRLMTVMLDSILSNAVRHSFHKNRNHTDKNLVEISLDLEQYEGNPYVVMRVANNGDSFKEGFTIDDYVTRGRFSSDTGRSGLGGFHVFEVVKGHNGFVYIDSNKVWNVIIEILLPYKYFVPGYLKEYEHECI